MKKQISFNDIKYAVLFPYYEMRKDDAEARTDFYNEFDSVKNMQDLFNCNLLDGLNDFEIISMVANAMDEMFFGKEEVKQPEPASAPTSEQHFYNKGTYTEMLYRFGQDGCKIEARSKSENDELPEDVVKYARIIKDGKCITVVYLHK